MSPQRCSSQKGVLTWGMELALLQPRADVELLPATSPRSRVADVPGDSWAVSWGGWTTPWVPVRTRRCGASTDIQAVNIYTFVWVRNKNVFCCK